MSDEVPLVTNDARQNDSSKALTAEDFERLSSFPGRDLSFFAVGSRKGSRGCTSDAQ